MAGPVIGDRLIRVPLRAMPPSDRVVGLSPWRARGIEGLMACIALLGS